VIAGHFFHFFQEILVQIGADGWHQPLNDQEQTERGYPELKQRLLA